MASLPLGPPHPPAPEALRIAPRLPEMGDDKVFSALLSPSQVASFQISAISHLSFLLSDFSAFRFIFLFPLQFHTKICILLRSFRSDRRGDRI